MLFIHRSTCLYQLPRCNQTWERLNLSVMNKPARVYRYLHNEASSHLRHLTYKLNRRRKLARIGLLNNSEIWKESNHFVQQFMANLPKEVTGFGGALEAIYYVIRVVHPARVVETGVANGVSSRVILEALEKNAFGTLFSIDLPNKDPSALVPRGRETGWLIPKCLKPRWHLLTGKSGEILPGLLAQIQPIEIFYHDSEHSYRNMTFEFSSAWSSLRKGGLLVSDNTDLNTAFQDFCARIGCNNIVLANVGFARK